MQRSTSDLPQAIQLNDVVAEVALREGVAPRYLRKSLIVAKQKIDEAQHDDQVEFLLGRTLG